MIYPNCLLYILFFPIPQVFNQQYFDELRQGDISLIRRTANVPKYRLNIRNWVMKR